jgi:hypothetical protein
MHLCKRASAGSSANSFAAIAWAKIITEDNIDLFLEKIKNFSEKC